MCQPICIHHIVGAQLREWLLYFSLPVLKVILPPSQLYHYCYLVAGIHVVLSDAISDDNLSCAEMLSSVLLSIYQHIW